LRGSVAHRALRRELLFLASNYERRLGWLYRNNAEWQHGLRAGEILAVPAPRKDGPRISIEFTILPFRDNASRITGIAAILRDVNVRFEEMRKLQRQLTGRRQGEDNRGD
jgi:hypothetical protein